MIGSLVSTMMGSVFDKRVFFGCYFTVFCVFQSSQVLQHLPSGILLGSFFCGTGSAPNNLRLGLCSLRTKSDFHREHLVVLRTLFFYEGVGRLGATLYL